MRQVPENNIPEILSARVPELKPLVAVWIKKNRGIKVSSLVRRGLKLALKPYAGKRYAHLVENL